jgi:hypothetical protein
MLLLLQHILTTYTLAIDAHFNLYVHNHTPVEMLSFALTIVIKKDDEQNECTLP